jgi:uncharacterized protein (TIGR00299 family) protein
MKTGYFDCFAGAGGDMILGCLFDLGFDKADLLDGMAGLGLEGVEIEVKEVIRKVIRATAVDISFPEDQPHRTHKDIDGMIERSGLSDAVKKRSRKAFDILADAESRVHGTPKEDVHFHEVGAVDSIVDVVGAFIGLEKLKIEDVISSPLALGTGSVECRHGTLPRPAPATMEIARGLPVRGRHLSGEMTTPTGAAILKAAASGFGSIPEMLLSSIGYGAGSRDLKEIPNVMRLVVGQRSVGEREAANFDQVSLGGVTLNGVTLDRVSLDRVALLETNIDDMNPEYFSHIYDDLFRVGALDVWVTPVLMKKGRPGFVLSVLASQPVVSALTGAILSGTTTAGVRLTEVDRCKLEREIIEVDTRFGKVKVKVFTLGAARRCAPEYEDCLRVSRARSVSIDDVIEDARNAFKDTLKDRS